MGKLGENCGKIMGKLWQIFEILQGTKMKNYYNWRFEWENYGKKIWETTTSNVGKHGQHNNTIWGWAIPFIYGDFGDS